MERLEVALSAFSRRSRSVVVHHADTPLDRGLEPGEYVVLHDPADGADFVAAVADIGFEIADTVYRFQLGSRLSTQEAAEWVARAPDLTVDGPVSTRQLIELLGELRRSERELRSAFDDIASS